MSINFSGMGVGDMIVWEDFVVERKVTMQKRMSYGLRGLV